MRRGKGGSDSPNRSPSRDRHRYFDARDMSTCIRHLQKDFCPHTATLQRLESRLFGWGGRYQFRYDDARSSVAIENCPLKRCVHHAKTGIFRCRLSLVYTTLLNGCPTGSPFGSRNDAHSRPWPGSKWYHREAEGWVHSSSDERTRPVFRTVTALLIKSLAGVVPLQTACLIS